MSARAGEDFHEHRPQHIGPLVTDFETWRHAVGPTLLPSEPLAAAIRHYADHGDALLRFVDGPDVPSSPAAPRGAYRACVLLGIVATCRA